MSLALDSWTPFHHHPDSCPIWKAESKPQQAPELAPASVKSQTESESDLSRHAFELFRIRVESRVRVDVSVTVRVGMKARGASLSHSDTTIGQSPDTESMPGTQPVRPAAGRSLLG